MPEAKFLLKEPKSTQKTLIYLFYNFDKQRLKYSTGEKILPKDWNTTKQRAKASFAEHTSLNERLKDIEAAINKCYRNLQIGREVITPERLRQELEAELNEEAKAKEIVFLDWVLQEIEVQKKHKKPGTIQTYNSCYKKLCEFVKERNFKLSFDSIDMDFYDEFKDYCLNEDEQTTNTFGKNVKIIKTFLNIATEKGINKNLKFRSPYFKVLEEEVDDIYLNEEELKLIYELDLTDKPNLDKYRDLFIIGCYTGLRFSDFTTLTKEDFVTVGGALIIRVHTQKTGELVEIPLKPLVRDIMEKYDWQLPSTVNNPDMNQYIKDVGELVGLNSTVVIKRVSGKDVAETVKQKYELIKTHTARRSFATNAYLAGVPTISIMKITGHKSEKTFLRYIRITKEENAQLLKSHPYFNQL